MVFTLIIIINSNREVRYNQTVVYWLWMTSWCSIKCSADPLTIYIDVCEKLWPLSSGPGTAQKCSVVSSSSLHSSQIGSDDITPVLHRWLCLLLWLISILITWHSLGDSRLSRHLDVSSMGVLMKNYVWWHVVRPIQYFECSFKIHHLILFLAILVDNGKE